MITKYAKLLGVSGVMVVLSLMTVWVAYAHSNSASNPQLQQDDDRTYLGVQVRETDAGVVVFYIFSGSAADIAGLRIDDVILKFNDVEISTSADLLHEVENSAPGDSVVLTVRRGEETLELTAELTAFPFGTPEVFVPPADGEIIIWGEGGMPGQGPRGWGGYGFGWHNAPLQLGVNFTSLTPEIADSEGIAVEEGALVTEVVEGTPAEDSGLAVGDVITAVDDDAVDIEHTLSDRLFAYEAQDHVMLTVQRGDETLEIGVVLASDHPAKRNRGAIDVLLDGPWNPDAGGAFPWLNHPIEIDGLPIDDLHIEGMPWGENISIQMSSEPPTLDSIPEGATVYECTMPGNDHALYIITAGMDAPPPMLNCEPYLYEADQSEN